MQSETTSVPHHKPKAGKKAALKKASAKAERKLRSLGLEQVSHSNVPKKEKKAVSGPVAMQRKIKASAEKEMLRAHLAVPDRTGGHEAPRIVVVMGPKGVGKSTIIRCLVKHYTKKKVGQIVGPITVLSGVKKRLSFLEVGGELPSMIDAAKIADLVLLVIDASFGFEMETFEFLNICSVHGMPRVIGILTHLDKIREGKQMKKMKKHLKNRFTNEITQGAKLFCFSGLTLGGEYLKREVLNLARFVSVTKFKTITWRNEHGYILVDRLEDKTEESKDDTKSRTVAFFGYLHGTYLRFPRGVNFKMHLPGVGDITVNHVEQLPDPCPLPNKEDASKSRKRKLSDKERAIHAPMGEVSGISYDQDAIYINLPNQTVRLTGDIEPESEGEVMIRNLQRIKSSMDDKLQSGKLDILRQSLLDQNSKDLLDSKKFLEEFASDIDSQEGSMENSLDEIFDNKDEDPMANEFKSENVGFESRDENDGIVEKWKLAKDDFQLDTRPKNLTKWIYDKRLAPTEVCLKDLGSFIFSGSEEADCSKFIASKSWDLLNNSSLKRRFSNSELVEENSNLSAESDDGYFTADACEDSSNDDSELDSETCSDVGLDDSSPEVDNEDATSVDSQEKRMRKKTEKKIQFDAAYDADALDKYSSDEDVSFDQALKLKLAERESKKKQKLATLDEESRQMMEGFPPGSYLRLQVDDVPEDFLRYFNPFAPILLGAVKIGEEQFCHIRARLKRHRWRKGLLKCGDPLIFSIGWRRFQSIPVYSSEDQNGRNRYLKYTPEHLHCDATFFGPRVALGTGVICFQRLDGPNTSNFRVAASGYISEVSGDFNIVKKLKLIGEPLKIFKNSAFVRGMFHSDLEVSKYLGAKIRTVSGIRGAIKKALKSPPGAFRATFEDKILMSDIVFLRAWVKVAVESYCVDVQDRLCPPSVEIRHLMKTLRELRVMQQIPIPTNDDSEYRKIDERPAQRNFRPFHIPRSLQATLPFSSKPKQISAKEKQRRSNLEKVMSAVTDPEERKEQKTFQMLNTIRNERTKKREMVSKARLEAKRKDMEKQEAERQQRIDERRKRRYKSRGAARKRQRTND
ncbi:Ribosome biogenesis protein bms1 [Galdieria sulphuraria]|uniref:Bms1-type G domain-containing protein n=1 Tax=Galdieria sulphuraria TaxID=130081 RepID=M2W7Q2_GALSU|nr:uncharacterized protein Gasu_09100 [Galdieria sulphuraria]EME31836.1 hypothetical protein Gasu_09100 [Galdieria sulphuraria]GJD10339.1 Ribosome biogenesis protein bms1 [Galdieria sulphuraria]|eukprot:XP_005708356.1 hypothetical protein Gasu_09100 [Galdieria sulphuraria]